jgi:outer membrane protein assembly factor BamA
MRVTFLKTAICLGGLLLAATPVLPQIYRLPPNTPAESLKAMGAPILDELRFTGLRHIAPAAVAAQIRSHPGDRFDLAKLDGDIRALARLGWFESIQVQATPSTAPSLQLQKYSNCITLIFHLTELPFLSNVEYSGSGLLSQKQIEKMLEDKKLSPPLGKPADPAALYRIALAIRAGLNELFRNQRWSLATRPPRHLRWPSSSLHKIITRADAQHRAVETARFVARQEFIYSRRL